MTVPATGDTLPTWSAGVDPEQLKIFSLITDDPNPIHWNPDDVRALGLGDRCVSQGGLNLAFVAAALAEAHPRGRVRSLRCRFVGNVFAGDEIRVDGRAHSTDDAQTEIDFELTAPGGVALRGTAIIDTPEETHG
jgi:acyl dehydratase